MYSLATDRVSSVARIHSSDCLTYQAGRSYSSVRDAWATARDYGLCVRL